MLRFSAIVILLSVMTAAVVRAQDPNSANPKERRRAAEALASQGVEAIPQLQKMLSDQDVDVRIEAVKSLVQVDTQRSLDPLIQAARDNDPEIQIRATDGLVNFYLPGYVQTGLTASIRRVGTNIRSTFSETNDQVIDPFLVVRPEVVGAIGRIASGGASMESRANAARAVGILRGKEAVPELLKAIRSKDTRVIYECLIALQKIRDESAGPAVSFLLRDLDPKVQVAAVETAGLLYNREALPQLRKLLGETKNKNVRRSTLGSIAMLRDPADRDLFKTYLRDKDGEVREAAAEGLGRMADPSDLAILETRFNDERDNSVRVSIAFALVMLGKIELSEFSPLQYLVNTLNSGLRADEARALLVEAARKPEVRRALEQPMMRGTASERMYLAQIMGRSGDRDTVPLLQQLTKDADVRVAQEAVTALRGLKARIPQ